MVSDTTADMEVHMVADIGADKKMFVADMELDMVSDKVAGHRCWFMGPNFFGPNLSQLAHLLSFASLFQTY